MLQPRQPAGEEAPPSPSPLPPRGVGRGHPGFHHVCALCDPPSPGGTRGQGASPSREAAWRTSQPSASHPSPSPSPLRTCCLTLPLRPREGDWLTQANPELEARLLVLCCLPQVVPLPLRTPAYNPQSTSLCTDFVWSFLPPLRTGQQWEGFMPPSALPLQVPFLMQGKDLTPGSTQTHSVARPTTDFMPHQILG